MIIGKESDKTRIPKPAGGHTMRFCTLMLLWSAISQGLQIQPVPMTYMAQRELSKVSLEVIVASDSSILGYDKQFLVFWPSEASYQTFIPLELLEFHIN